MATRSHKSPALLKRRPRRQSLLDRSSPIPREAMYGADEAGSGANGGDMDQSFHPARTREAGHARRCLDMHGIQRENRMLRLAIGRALLWFLLPAAEQKWRSDGKYLRQARRIRRRHAR